MELNIKMDEEEYKQFLEFRERQQTDHECVVKVIHPYSVGVGYFALGTLKKYEFISRNDAIDEIKKEVDEKQTEIKNLKLEIINSRIEKPFIRMSDESQRMLNFQNSNILERLLIAIKNEL